MLAERGDSDEGSARTAAAPNPSARRLFEAHMTPEGHSTNIDAAFAADGRTLALRVKDKTTLLAVPPWGERLRDRLRHAVQEMQAQQGKAASAY